MAFDKIERAGIYAAIRTDLAGDPNAATRTENRIKILEKMGFTEFDQVRFFDAEQMRNPELKKILEKHEGKLASSPQYDPVLKAIGKDVLAAGEKVKFNPAASGTTPTVLDHLGNDLRNDKTGQLGARLDKLMGTGRPEAMTALASNLGGYTTGSMNRVLSAAEPKPAAAAAPASPPPATPSAPKAAATPAPKTAAAPKAAAEPVRAPSAAAPAAPVKPEPVKVAAATQVEPTTEPAPAPAQTVQSAPPSQAPEAVRETAATAAPAVPLTPIQMLATASDAEVSKFIGKPSNVKEIGQAIAQYGSEKYGTEMDTAIKGFSQKLNNDEGLQKRIGDNLAQNPALLRNLAQMMEDKSGNADTPMAKSAIKEKLEEVFADPEKLAKKSYTDKLSQDISSMKGMGGMMAKLSNMLGVDLSGVGNMLGGLLGGFMTQLSSFFSGPSLHMGNGTSMFANLGERWRQAGIDADNEPFYKQYSTIVPRADAKDAKISNGDYKVTSQRTNENGETVNVTETKNNPANDHRFEVKLADGSKTKVYLDAGIGPQLQADGQFKWSVTKSMSESGDPGRKSTIYLDRAETDRLYKELDASARKANITLNMEAPDKQVAKQQPALPPGTVSVDPKNGQTSLPPSPEELRQYQAPQVQAPRDPANDPNFMMNGTV